MGNGKKKESSDYGYVDSKSIKEQQQLLAKKLRQAPIPCSHTKNSGKLRVDFLHDATCQCRECQIKFSLKTYQYKETMNAYGVMHDILNQLKVFSNDPQADRDLIIKIGRLDYELFEAIEMYLKAAPKFNDKDHNNSKKKHGKNRHNDNFGSYGIQSISFSSGKKRR